jgi:hypothetical protein
MAEAMCHLIRESMENSPGTHFNLSRHRQKKMSRFCDIFPSLTLRKIKLFIDQM